MVSRQGLLPLAGIPLLSSCGGGSSSGSAGNPGNPNITLPILQEDAKGYNGTWSGTFLNASRTPIATIQGVVNINPQGRTLS